MDLSRLKIDFRKLVILIAVEALLISTTIAQQKAEISDWQIYSPDGASFSIQVPSTPLPAQGHIFDPSDNKLAYQMIDDALSSKTYNFEINKKGKRSFLVSILELQLATRRHKFITDSEVKHINFIIADEIVHSKIVRRAMGNGEVSQWSYKIKGGFDDDDSGMVYVRRWGNYMVIIVVDYDYATSEDKEIKDMLDSLRLQKGGTESDDCRTKPRKRKV
jgi:hypothetical protein